MNDTSKGEPLSEKTYKDVIAHLKNENKDIFRHIINAGQEFQNAMYVYMGDFMEQEMVPDSYD